MFLETTVAFTSNLPGTRSGPENFIIVAICIFVDVKTAVEVWINVLKSMCEQPILINKRMSTIS